MNIIIKRKHVLIALMCCILISCEDFLEIDAPKHTMISEVVFDSDELAVSAMKGIYNQLFRASFSGGNFDSVSILAGLSSDVLTTIHIYVPPYVQFDELEIQPDNSRNRNLWSGAYNIIYLTNSLLEGIENSGNLSEDVYRRLKGEASFIRAFTHFYLINLYGEVPLVITTNYEENALATKSSKEDIYDQILVDLQTSEDLLGDDYSGGERTQINRFTATAMLARVHLYLGNWVEAEKKSSEVIAQKGLYEILDDLDKVFLSNSKEAIWQLSPEGRGSLQTQTNEGARFIIDPDAPWQAELKLEPSFVNILEPTDKRNLYWVGFDEGLEAHFANKYKIRISNSLPIEEYSMVLRLAEQYLIRAEARAMTGNLEGAIADLDIIRNRAGISLLSEINPQLSNDQFLDLILDERKRELFTEWGHRWLDLKRTGKSSEIFSQTHPTWQESDVLYPIPEAEVMKNPKLHQNPGY